jgi:uncharacterized protein YjbI with pentapeptide repeats
MFEKCNEKYYIINTGFLSFVTFKECIITGGTLNNVSLYGSMFIDCKLNSIDFGACENEIKISIPSQEEGVDPEPVSPPMNYPPDPLPGIELNKGFSNITFSDTEVNSCLFEFKKKVLTSMVFRNSTFNSCVISGGDYIDTNIGGLFEVKNTTIYNVHVINQIGIGSIKLTNCTMDRSYFNEFNIIDSNITNFNSSGITNSNLINCVFDDIDSNNSCITSSILQNCSFNNSKMNDFNFSNSDLTDCAIENIISDILHPPFFVNAKMLNSSFSTNNDKTTFFSNFANTQLNGINFNNITFTHGIFNNCDLRNILFENCELKGIECNNSRLENVIFRNNTIRGSVFKGSAFYGVSFNNDDLSGVNFINTIRSNFRINNCVTHGVDYGDVE